MVLFASLIAPFELTTSALLNGAGIAFGAALGRPWPSGNM